MHFYFIELERYKENSYTVGCNIHNYTFMKANFLMKFVEILHYTIYFSPVKHLHDSFKRELHILTLYNRKEKNSKLSNGMLRERQSDGDTITVEPVGV